MESELIPKIPIEKEKKAWEILKKEVSASEVAYEIGVNYRAFIKWIKYQLKEGKVEISRKAGSYIYYKKTGGKK